jgi:hypothetical protein
METSTGNESYALQCDVGYGDDSRHTYRSCQTTWWNCQLTCTHFILLLPLLLNWLTKSLCEIWGFHGSDYEEWRLLGYKNPVRTSQEAHYFSTTVPSQLMLCKIWGFHGGDYEECRLLGYKNTVRTSQETHYVSATESSQLMLCKIWGFHFGDYEECRLLGYKNPVRTSQETHYVSATNPSQLMLCKIWSIHARDYKEWCLLGCYAMWLL